MDGIENLLVANPTQTLERPIRVDKTPLFVEMGPILQKVPPIEGIFNPEEEVQKLWLVPKKQRKEAVSVFRDKLTRQREAWALCRTTIEERIEANPDIQRSEMVGIIDQFASDYGFAEPHTKIAEQLVDAYIYQHMLVAETRKEYKDDLALVNQLTGIEFAEDDAKDFTVQVGPMSFEIFCSESNAGRIYEKSQDPIVGFKNSGFAAVSRGLNPVYYLVVNKDRLLSNPDPNFRTTVVQHEREHQENRILKEKLYGRSEVRADVRAMLNQGVLGFLRHQIGEKLFNFERNFQDEIFKRYKSTRDPGEKAFLLGEYMRLRREWALNKAKDEIMARRAEPNYYEGLCNLFFKEDSDYDYLKNLKEWGDYKNDTLWIEISKRVLVDEYRDIINSAIVAFDGLRNNGYSQKEVIAMLSDRRLSDWPKTVGRLLEAKQSQD